MNTYNLCVDELVQVWKRTYVKVEANSEKESIDKYLDDNYEVDSSEYLFNTEEFIDPEEGPTMEIINDEGETIYNNYKEKF